MTHQPARDATLSAARYAKAHGIKLSFDPNYRASLWDDEETALRVIREGMSLADYVKVSDEEALLLTGQSDPKAAAQRLLDEYAPEFIAVTLGAQGSAAMTGDAYEYVSGFAIKAVDTTGAGDAFWGAALHKLLEIQEQNRTLDADCLKELLFYANAAGALTTIAFGGQTAQPDDRQIKNFVKLYCKV